MVVRLRGAVLGLALLVVGCGSAGANGVVRQYMPIGPRNADSLQSAPVTLPGPPTATSTPTSTATPASSPGSVTTPSAAGTSTATSTQASIATLTAAAALTSSPVSTSSPTRTATPSVSPTVTPTATMTPTPTPTYTPTPTFTPTATPSATPPSGIEIAAGQGGSTFASSTAAGKTSELAVDALGGGPNGQNDATYWQAGAVAVAGANQSWTILLGADRTVSAVQARLALPTNGWVRVVANLNDSGGRQLATLTLYDGEAVDGQAIGAVAPVPVPGVRLVFLVFTQSPGSAGPGLRTVGVYVQ